MDHIWYHLAGLVVGNLTLLFPSLVFGSEKSREAKVEVKGLSIKEIGLQALGIS